MRHKIFCELQLYGQYVHPTAIEFVTRIKAVFETLSYVDNIGELAEVLPLIVGDCEESLVIVRGLPPKYAKLIVNMEELKNIAYGEPTDLHQNDPLSHIGHN